MQFLLFLPLKFSDINAYHKMKAIRVKPNLSGDVYLNGNFKTMHEKNMVLLYVYRKLAILCGQRKSVSLFTFDAELLLMS